LDVRGDCEEKEQEEREEVVGEVDIKGYSEKGIQTPMARGRST